MRNQWAIIFYYIIIIRLILNIFFKAIYHKKTTKFGSQNFGYQIWFCSRLLNYYNWFDVWQFEFALFISAVLIDDLMMLWWLIPRHHSNARNISVIKSINVVLCKNHQIKYYYAGERATVRGNVPLTLNLERLEELSTSEGLEPDDIIKLLDIAAAGSWREYWVPSIRIRWVSARKT